MQPKAQVVHKIRGRLRLRIREKRQEDDYFEGLRSRIETVDGIDEVRVNSSTGSVVLLHSRISFEDLVDRLNRLALFEILEGPEPEAPALAALQSGIAMFDEAVNEQTSGVIDLRTIVVIAAVGLAIRQMFRGELLGPAMPLLWSAIDLAIRFANSNTVPDEE